MAGIWAHFALFSVFFFIFYFLDQARRPSFGNLIECSQVRPALTLERFLLTFVTVASLPRSHTEEIGWSLLHLCIPSTELPFCTVLHEQCVTRAPAVTPLHLEPLANLNDAQEYEETLKTILHFQACCPTAF